MKQILRATSLLTALAVVACAHGPAATRNVRSEFEAKRWEEASCRLAPLSEQAVMEIAKRLLGKHYSPTGFPEPNRRVQELGCIYVYEQSAYYIKGEPANLDHIDSSFSIFIARDGSYDAGFALPVRD